MRIGIIATEFPPSLGGMQVMALNLALTLSQRHEVVVFMRKGQDFPAPSFRTAPVLDGDIDRDIVELSKGDVSGDVDVWLAMNAGYAALAGRLDKPMAVFCNGNDFLTPWVIGTPRLIDRLERMPHVWRYAERLRQAWRRRVLMNGLSRAEALFPISENSRDLLVRRFGIERNRPTVIHPGVEDDFFQPRFFQPRPAGSDGPLRLLTVARLDARNRRKNVDGVLRAIALLREEMDIQYTVVGEGADKARLEALAHDLGITDQVRFAGRLDKSGILVAYRDADLFVLAAKASATDVEGFGIVYVEANASGVPVLCSRRGGAVDAVRHGETGILIEEADPESIADGIRDFRDSSHTFDAARIASYAENFRWRSVADKVETTLLAIAEDRARSRGGRDLPAHRPLAEHPDSNGHHPNSMRV
jgi:glycosyltransferase involved in cell wall biosynthesis